jgi:type IV pilus assembly protein PilM
MPAVGIDIGSTSIKVVQLEKAGGRFRLLAAGAAPCPSPGLLSDADEHIEQVAQAVKKLLSDTKISTTKAYFSIPESKAFSRIVKLPYLTDREIDSAISWQAETYIPIPVAESSFDYQILQRIEPVAGKQGEVDVLLVATPKSVISKYLKLGELLGLEVAALRTDLLSLAKALAPADKLAVLLDMGAQGTGIAVCDLGKVYVSRTTLTGGNVFTRALSTALEVSLEQAEEYKKAYGLSDQLEGKIKDILSPLVATVVDEIKKTFQYYKAETGSEKLMNYVIVSGGSAGMPGLVPYLAKELAAEVDIADPFSFLIRDEQAAKAVAAYAPLYGIATGLAMEE